MENAKLVNYVSKLGSRDDSVCTSIIRSASQYDIEDASAACTAICFIAAIDIMRMSERDEINSARIRKWMKAGAALWKIWYQKNGDIDNIYPTVGRLLHDAGCDEPYRDIGGCVGSRPFCQTESDLQKTSFQSIDSSIDELEAGKCLLLTVHPYTVLIHRVSNKVWWFFDSHGRDDRGLCMGSQSFFMATCNQNDMLLHLDDLFPKLDAIYSASYVECSPKNETLLQELMPS